MNGQRIVAQFILDHRDLSAAEVNFKLAGGGVVMNDERLNVNICHGEKNAPFDVKTEILPEKHRKILTITDGDEGQLHRQLGYAYNPVHGDVAS